MNRRTQENSSSRTISLMVLATLTISCLVVACGGASQQQPEVEARPLPPGEKITLGFGWKAGMRFHVNSMDVVGVQIQGAQPKARTEHRSYGLEVRPGDQGIVVGFKGLEKLIDQRGNLVSHNLDEMKQKQDSEPSPARTKMDKSLLDTSVRMEWDRFIGMWAGKTLEQGRASKINLRHHAGTATLTFEERMDCPMTPSRPDARCVALKSRFRISRDNVVYKQLLKNLKQGSFNQYDPSKCRWMIAMIAEEQTLVPQVVIETKECNFTVRTQGRTVKVQTKEIDTELYSLVFNPEQLASMSFSSEKQALRTTHHSFQGLLVLNDGDDGPGLVSTKTREIFEELARKAKTVTRESLKNLPAAQQFVTLLLRHAPRKTSGQQLDSGQALSTFFRTYRDTSLLYSSKQTKINGDEASAFYKIPNTRITTWKRENGQWKVEVFALMEPHFDAFLSKAKQKGLSFDEFAVKMLKNSGINVTLSTLWDEPAHNQPSQIESPF